MGEWKIVKEAAATEDGMMQRVCANTPSHVQQQIIPATGEQEPTVPEEPGQEEDWVTSFRCKMCAAYEANKDVPFVGIIYTIVHFFVHFAHMISALT